MPIIDNTGNEPVAHTQNGNECICPICNWSTQHVIAFAQHMAITHGRRYNRVTQLWEKTIRA